MQRNWASLWLMSQERGLWPERPADESAVPRKVGEASKTRDSADDRYLAAPLARDEVRRGPQPIASSPIDVRTIDSRPIRPETIHRRFRDESVGDRADPERADPENLAAESEWTAESPALATETSTPEDLDLAAQASELSADRGHLLGGYRSLTDGTTFDEIPTDAVTTDAITRDADPASPRHRFGDLRVILRFHRADLYLGVAVFVAAVALMWPAASAPRPSALGPMDRALIALGIAEAPAPAAVHSKGDPGVNVWVDPHTALYYCPGEELYGKAADGRVSTQHDAQMDRFQPAERVPCE